MKTGVESGVNHPFWPILPASVIFRDTVTRGAWIDSFDFDPPLFLLDSTVAEKSTSLVVRKIPQIVQAESAPRVLLCHINRQSFASLPTKYIYSVNTTE